MGFAWRNLKWTFQALREIEAQREKERKSSGHSVEADHTAPDTTIHTTTPKGPQHL